MEKRLFDRKETIKKTITISFTLYILLVIIITVLEFFIFVEPSVGNKIIQMKVQSQEDFDEIIRIVRRSLGLAIVNMVFAGIILLRINIKKLFKPIKKLNEATKKVTNGDYDIELETNRKDEIGELTKNFNKMIKALQSTENIQKEFINNVSHEIKTPISSIEGFAKFLKDKDLSDSEREEYSNIIIEESERLVNLTGKMLKLSKLQNQEIIFNKQEFIIAEQIRRAISVLEPKWSKKNITINVNMQEKVFAGDEELIFQVWMNLIENAIKFSKENGKIDIKVFQEKEKLIVTIKDYGRGMPEDKIEKVFDKFYQIDASHSEEGSGLGLSIVKRIIELSEGEINLQSRENKGTIVTVKLPIFSYKDNKIYIE